MHYERYDSGSFDTVTHHISEQDEELIGKGVIISSYPTPDHPDKSALPEEPNHPDESERPNEPDLFESLGMFGFMLSLPVPCQDIETAWTRFPFRRVT